MSSANKLNGASYIKQKLEKNKIPRNQLASLSGLTNTYIRDIEQGKTFNIERERLIALAFSMDLTLIETDEFLNHFDRIKLSEDDISSYIDLAKKNQPSSILHPIRSQINYELLLLGTELTPGNKKVVHNHLTAVLFAEGYRSYMVSKDDNDHPLFSPLVESIGKERKRNLIAQLPNYHMDHYISQDCLIHYLRECKDPVEQKFRYNNLESVILFLKNYRNFNYYITNIGHTFEFTAKYSKDTSNISRIFFEGCKDPDSFGKFGRQLSGFCTSNETLFNQFNIDLEIQHNHVVEEYLDRERLISYIESFL